MAPFYRLHCLRLYPYGFAMHYIRFYFSRQAVFLKYFCIVRMFLLLFLIIQ